MKNPIQVLGSNILISNSVDILIRDSSINLFSTTITNSKYEIKLKLKTKSSNKFEFQLPLIPLNISQIQILISFNSQNYFHEIKKINLFRKFGKQKI